MLNDLIKMASKLDALGFKREADTIDSLIKKVAGDKDGVFDSASYIVKKIEPGSDWKDWVFDSASYIASTVEPERDRSKAFDSSSYIANRIEPESSDEPPVDHEALKKAYEEYTERALDVNSVKVTDLYWVQNKEDPRESHYLVTAEGLWNDSDNQYMTEDGFSIWPIPQSYGRWSMDIEGNDGKMYYFQADL